MKIGILTYHRSHNFGALFQAIASRRYLESLGHEVYYINYWPKYHRAMYSPFSFWLLRRKRPYGMYLYIKNCLKNLSANLKRTKRYSRFIRQYMEPHYAPSKICFDAIFYGSDQIWRVQPYINDFNPVYFAHNQFQAKKHIALSASAGILPKNDEETGRFKSLLDSFDSISVREESLKDLVESLGHKAQLTCDPALFLTAEQWDGIFPRQELNRNKYLLFVNYIEGSFNKDEVKRLAEAKGLDYVCINGSAISHYEDGDLCNVAPLELFDYIRNADFVCSSSFHALVFSLLYHKQFLVSFKHNARRAESLLNLLDLDDHILEPGSVCPVDNEVIDYGPVDHALDKLRGSTFSFIHTSLEGNGK